MDSAELRQKFKSFFEEKEHTWIPSASLIPKDDPSVLFTTAGMHPLVPYLLGQEHPKGKRLVNWQKCVRTGDIDEVGDASHLTFFEMLGNWSLGDYWKKESIEWSWEFLTNEKWLGLDQSKLAVSVFAGDEDAPKDEESVEIWKSLNIAEERIAYLGKENNWWPAGGKNPGPQGPDTEIFYWIGQGDAPANFDPNDSNWIEIWNNVFMQFNRTAEGELVPLEQKNVDTGMGFERMSAVMQNAPTVFDTDLFKPLIEAINSLADSMDVKEKRVIADHMRAAVFIIADGITPSNKERGYVLRRLIRRAVTYAAKHGIENEFTQSLAEIVIQDYSKYYPELGSNAAAIKKELSKEEKKFRATLNRGLKLIEGKTQISGKEAFDLFQTYGFPLELTRELVGITNEKEFEEEYAKHQELSRTSSAGQFKGGLADSSSQTVKHHTATHLLNAALHKVLGEHVQQKGSNVNEERTRFDFNHNTKLSDEEKQHIESLVNEWIVQGLEVKQEIMPRQKAEELGAIGVFGEKYPDEVSVYTVWNPQTGEVVSREFCGGPHVENTSELGSFKIIKEESSSAGVRRIKAKVS